jgi:hypothetical protein
LEPELVEQEPQFGVRLGVAGEHEFAAIGCRYVDVDHLNGRELLEHATRGEAGRQSMQAPPERDVEAIGQESNEDVGLDACFLLMEDRPDGEIALEGLEGLFYRDQLQVIPAFGRADSWPSTLRCDSFLPE